MKKISYIFVLVFLPFVAIADLVIFLGASKPTSCLSCEMSEYFTKSSMSAHLVSNAFLTVQSLVSRSR